MNTEECLNLFLALKIFPCQKIRPCGTLIITDRTLHVGVSLSVGFQTSSQKGPTEMEDWLKIKS